MESGSPSMNKLIADRVYGTSFAMDKKHHLMVFKFDLGNHRRSIHIQAGSVRWLLGRLPTMGGHILGLLPTSPEITQDDWDGSKTPMATRIRVNEAENGLAIAFDFHAAQSIALYFDLPNWKHFSDNLWRYQPILASPQPSDTHGAEGRESKG